MSFQSYSYTKSFVKVNNKVIKDKEINTKIINNNITKTVKDNINKTIKTKHKKFTNKEAIDIVNNKHPFFKLSDKNIIKALQIINKNR